MRPYDDVWGPEYGPGYDPNDTRSTYGGPASIPGTDEQGYINASPGVIAARTAAKENQQDAWNIRRAAIRQGIINYGGDLSGWTDKYGDIDAATRKAAAANQYSTLAQLARSPPTRARCASSSLPAGCSLPGSWATGRTSWRWATGRSAPTPPATWATSSTNSSARTPACSVRTGGTSRGRSPRPPRTP